jgi:hypothetical protein
MGMPVTGIKYVFRDGAPSIKKRKSVRINAKYKTASQAKAGFYCERP